MKLRNDIGFLALSTAFEDFELNTRENTTLLINKGTLVGETKKALFEQGIESLPYQLQFPIGMDAPLEPSQKGALIDNICALNPDFLQSPVHDQDAFRKRVLAFLDNQQSISLTFTANQFKGTPTIALFNDQYTLLESWFGHHSIKTIRDGIQKHR